MPEPIPGIHHITAITGDAQANFDFYTGFLGLRLVKKTVNFDDPGSYHLYYGDEVGHPGTILTFFAWPGAYRGTAGAGEVVTVSFAVPGNSFDDWLRRGREHNVEVEGPLSRFSGESFLSLHDPDGLHLEVVAGGPAYGFHSAALAIRGGKKTSELLTDSFGFRLAGEEGGRIRFHAPSVGAGATVDLLPQPDSARRGALGASSVHHIAWRTATDETQMQWRSHLIERGFNVTPVMDRQYFHSIYFREPGGILFEIATDPPGFATDETPEQLGTALKLPPWLESERSLIERSLPLLETVSHV